VRVLAGGSDSSFVGLSLTTDPSGSARAAQNRFEIDMQSYFDSSAGGGKIIGEESKTVNGIGTFFPASVLRSTPQAIGTNFVWQIQRFSTANIHFSLYSESGPPENPGAHIALVASGDQGVFQIPDPMYIMLEAAGTNATFDTVTINRPLAPNATSIPEPATCALMVVAASVAIAMSRRRSRR